MQASRRMETGGWDQLTCSLEGGTTTAAKEARTNLDGSSGPVLDLGGTITLSGSHGRGKGGAGREEGWRA